MSIFLHIIEVVRPVAYERKSPVDKVVQVPTNANFLFFFHLPVYDLMNLQMTTGIIQIKWSKEVEGRKASPAGTPFEGLFSIGN